MLTLIIIFILCLTSNAATGSVIFLPVFVPYLILIIIMILIVGITFDAANGSMDFFLWIHPLICLLFHIPICLLVHQIIHWLVPVMFPLVVWMLVNSEDVILLMVFGPYLMLITIIMIIILCCHIWCGN